VVLAAKMGVDAEETREAMPRLAEVPFDSEYKFMATFHDRPGWLSGPVVQRPHFESVKGAPDVVIGQYSGGDHCCTVANIIELRSDAIAVLGRIDGLDGLPFEGLEIRNLRKDKSWECVAHRPYSTTCGDQAEPADVLSIYAFINGQYVDSTNQYADYLANVLRQNLTKWRQEKNLSLGLLQTLAAQFAELGQKDEGKRFFAMNFNRFLPNLHQKGIDPNLCLDDLENLMDRLPNVQLGASQQPAAESRLPDAGVSKAVNTR
jgi:hypothetical protein